MPTHHNPCQRYCCPPCRVADWRRRRDHIHTDPAHLAARPTGTGAETPSGDDIETTSSPAQPTCPLCHTPFTRIRRQLYCTETCRKTAWRRRTAHTPTPAPIPPAMRRRETTIYACPDCDTRYLGDQRCPDCNTFCSRIGPGGPCPSCDEPVAISDLTDNDTPAEVSAMTDP